MKPRVITKCVANTYAAPFERIIEFAGTESDHAGLISFRLMPNGRLYVDIYRQGAKVDVHVAKPEPPTN